MTSRSGDTVESPLLRNHAGNTSSERHSFSLGAIRVAGEGMNGGWWLSFEGTLTMLHR